MMGGDVGSDMQGDPDLFGAYHSGFEEQTKGWPQKPLELAAKWWALAAEGFAWQACAGAGGLKADHSLVQATPQLDLALHPPTLHID
jgi:ribosomal RNA-processing protein 8